MSGVRARNKRDRRRARRKVKAGRGKCGPCAKRSFGSEHDAIMAVAAGATAAAHRVYRCPSGNGWHVTKRPRPDRT